MPFTGPGDDVLDAIEAGKGDDVLMKDFKLKSEEVKAFRSLYYGLTNSKIKYEEISNYYPELKSYFSGSAAPAIKQTPETPTIPKEDFTKPVKSPTVAESTARAATIPVKTGQVQKDVFDKKLQTAKTNLFNELDANDDVVEKLIRYQRYEDAKQQAYNEFAQSRRTDMPVAAALAGIRERVDPQIKPQDLPVSAEEVGRLKSEIKTNEPQARQFVNQLVVHKPEKAKELQSSMYALDASARMQERPASGNKIIQNIESIEKGDLKYNAQTGQLVKELPFFKALIAGVRQRAESLEGYKILQLPKDQVIKIMEARRAAYDPDDAVEVPKGAGEIGQMFGSEWATLLKGTATTMATSLVGAEGAAPYISAAINTPEYYKRGFEAAFTQSYNDLRNQGKSEDEAYEGALKQAKIEGKYNAAEGFISSYLGGRIGIKELPKFKITGGFKNAVKEVLAKSKHFAAETTIEGVTDGMVAAYLQDKKNEAAREAGMFRDDDTVREAFMGELTFALAAGTLSQVGRAAVDPKTYKKILYWITKQPEETTNAKLGEMVLNGDITKEDADDIQNQIKEQRAVDKTVPEDIKDVSRMAMIDKIAKRDELQKRLETEDEALHPPIKEEIKKLNEEILEHSTHKKEATETEEQEQTQPEGSATATAPEPGAAEIIGGTEGTAAPVTEPSANKLDALPDDVYINMYNDYRENLEPDETPLTLDEFKVRIETETISEQPPTQKAVTSEITDKSGNKYKAVADDHGSNVYSVKLYDGDKRIGTLRLKKKKDGKAYYATGVDVERKYQRQGLATKMYDLAEKQFNISIEPSTVQSKDGKAFWGNRRANAQNTDTSNEQHWTNPTTGQSFVLRDGKLYAKMDSGEMEFSEKAMQTQNAKEIVENIQRANVQKPAASFEESAGATRSKAPKQKVTQTQEKFYESNIGATPAQTGRIMPDPIVGKQPKKLPQIVKDVTTGLKQRLIYGKTGRYGGIGAYLPGFKGIKIKRNNDLDTIAHELGHAIDDHFDLYTKIAKDPVALTELDQFASFGSTPPTGHPNPRRYIDKEGFAEWLRAYVVNPAAAEQMAPKVTALYKANTSDKFRSTIQSFSDDIRILAGANGSDIMKANIEFEPDKPKGLLGKLFKKEETNNEFSITWVNKLAANFINPLAAFEKAFKYAKGLRGLDDVLPENDPLILSRILLGIDGKFGEILKSGMINGRGEVLSDGNGNAMNLAWLLAPFDNSTSGTVKADMQDTIAFMVAERTVELSKKFARGNELTGVGAGIREDFEVAQKALTEYYNGDPKRLARIQEAAKRYRQLADAILSYAVDKGRLSQEAYEYITENNEQYVALQRVMETAPGEEITGFEGPGAALGSATQFLHNIQGSTKTIKNPYSSLLDTLYKTMRESDRNDVLRAFRDLLIDPRFSNEGDPKRYSDIGIIAKDGDPDTISIFINGKAEKWRFQKDIHEQLKGLDKEAYRLPTLITLPATTLRFFTTHFPAFAVRNWVRDTQDRLIKSTTGSGFASLIGSQEDWHAIARAGGLNSGHYAKSKDYYYGLLTEAMSGMAKDKRFILADPALFKRMWGGYTDLLTKGETSNRVAEYRSAFKEAKKKGMDDYNASMYAAYKARNLIDFAIMGNWMKIANQIIPFSNAAVQGLRSAAYSFKENPGGFMLKTFAYSIVPGVAAWLWNHRNEEDEKLYEELPGYQRDMFWNFRVGPNKWLSIPKPYELAIPLMGVDRLLSYKYADNKKAFDGLAPQVLKLILPFDEGNIAGPYQTVIEGMANYDFFRERNIIPIDEDALNLAMRHTETASRLGQLLQRFSQIEAIKYIPFVQNLADIDARKWDHFLQRQFSYTGAFALKLSDIGRDDSRHKFDFTDTGLFKRSPAYNSKSVQDMIAYAKEFGLTRVPAYKAFNGIVGDYFNADTDEQREEIGNQLIDYSKELLKTWEEQKMDIYKIEAAEQKKAGQKKQSDERKAKQNQ